MPGEIGTQMPAGASPLQIAQKIDVIEAELGDDAVGASINLGFEIIHVGFKRSALRMLFRIARNRNLEIRDALQTCDEIGRIHVAARMGLVFGACALGRIAAQGHDVTYALIPVRSGDGVDLFFGCIDAGQMRGRLQRRLTDQASDSRVRAFARRAAGAVRDRDEFRATAAQAA